MHQPIFKDALSRHVEFHETDDEDAARAKLPILRDILEVVARAHILLLSGKTAYICFTSRNCSLSCVCSDLPNQILTDGMGRACDRGSRKDY